MQKKPAAHPPWNSPEYHRDGTDTVAHHVNGAGHGGNEEAADPTHPRKYTYLRRMQLLATYYILY